jgi:ketopantoate reductase
MRVVGVGALGGLVAARPQAAGSSVWLATRNAASAATLKASGLRVGGVGGAASELRGSGPTSTNPEGSQYHCLSPLLLSWNSPLSDASRFDHLSPSTAWPR